MEKETVWRLTEEDFRTVKESCFPNVTDEETEKIIERAKDKFSIDDWIEWVEAFIDYWREKEEKRYAVNYTMSGTIEITAESQEEAEELVEEITNQQILDGISQRIEEGCDVEIESVYEV